ncbi:pentapeptide repeat-containing protein [Rhodococcus sp. NPDC056506]|uniref:pentapeptide repeat-containing protein n=1 Tax=Rhodococcus sp. NPDC056506 TaxID=3345844 RepID=UPI0036729438
MKRTDISVLRRRWSDEDVEKLQAELLDQSRIVKPPHALTSPWTETADGLVDLRGLAAGSGGIDIRFLTLERIDLSFVKGALSVFESELFDCRFDFAMLTGQPRINRRFERCSFRGATLSRLALGPQIVDCDFTGAKALRLRSVPNTVFERCTFDGADLTGAQFSDTSFVDCTFGAARFSPSSSFLRCSFTRTVVEFSTARVSRTTSDGLEVPDQWAGEADATVALEQYAARYAQTIDAGEEGGIGLDPETQDR